MGRCSCVSALISKTVSQLSRRFPYFPAFFFRGNHAFLSCCDRLESIYHTASILSTFSACAVIYSLVVPPEAKYTGREILAGESALSPLSRDLTSVCGSGPGSREHRHTWQQGRIPFPESRHAGQWLRHPPGASLPRGSEHHLPRLHPVPQSGIHSDLSVRQTAYFQDRRLFSGADPFFCAV